jgi:hypothetical protein
MNCTNCGTPITPNERYCRNCGHDTLAETLRAPSPTQPYRPASPTQPPSVDPNARTEYLHISQPHATAEIPGHLSTASDAPRRSRAFIPLMVIGALVVIGIGITVAYLLLRGDAASPEGALPDHFGIFLRQGEGLSELRRRDFNNALEARDTLGSDTSLPEAAAQPVLILFAEAQDIPVSDLKLVQLDSLNQNGQVRYWSFQVAPVGGRRGMKQIRVMGGLQTGKYAFALINGYLNEGNHKFWPFEVKEGVAEPQEQPQTATIPVKGSPAATTASNQAGQTQPAVKPTPVNDPPPGAKLGYCNDTNVFVRSSPDLKARPVSKITKGQKLWAIGKSATTSTWNGVTSDWTQVQLYNSSQRGWVFSPFISY